MSLLKTNFKIVYALKILNELIEFFKNGINGFQKGLIMNLEVTQTFQNVEISYIFLNDMKICVYGIIFVLENDNENIDKDDADNNDLLYL